MRKEAEEEKGAEGRKLGGGLGWAGGDAGLKMASVPRRIGNIGMGSPSPVGREGRGTPARKECATGMTSFSSTGEDMDKGLV